MRINLYETLTGVNSFFQNALANSKGTLTEQEFEDLYNKIIQQKIEDKDIEALTANIKCNNFKNIVLKKIK
jgi:hypothetical protein